MKADIFGWCWKERRSDMCFATAALLAAGGGIVKGLGDIEGGYAARNAANYNAQVSENNAVVAKQNAESASQSGQAEIEQIGLRNANTAGRLKAAQAANNVDVNSGSAVKVQQGQDQAGQLDALNAEHDAMMKIYGYDVQATNFQAQAGLDKSEAEQDVTAGYFGAAGDLLSSASSLGPKWAPAGG